MNSKPTIILKTRQRSLIPSQVNFGEDTITSNTFTKNMLLGPLLYICSEKPATN